LVIDAPPYTLLDDPLKYLLADHVRQRAVCAALQDFAQQGQASRIEADKVIAFLSHDLLIHHADEVEDLFPAVRQRAFPEDNLDTLLTRLERDHRRSDILVERIVTALSGHQDLDPVPIGTSIGELMTAYAASEHRHLAMENGVVLVIAQIRLNSKDLHKLSKGMKARRGVAT
jgi:hemerythrin-like domain-containing protein